MSNLNSPPVVIIREVENIQHVERAMREVRQLIWATIKNTGFIFETEVFNFIRMFVRSELISNEEVQVVFRSVVSGRYRVIPQAQFANNSSVIVDIAPMVLILTLFQADERFRISNKTLQHLLLAYDVVPCLAKNHAEILAEIYESFGILYSIKRLVQKKRTIPPSDVEMSHIVTRVRSAVHDLLSKDYEDEGHRVQNTVVMIYFYLNTVNTVCVEPDPYLSDYEGRASRHFAKTCVNILQRESDLLIKLNEMRETNDSNLSDYYSKHFA